jgi:glycosyltransferase involved in cell wall biosynthesis
LITVIVPCHNERWRVQPLLRDIAIFMRKYPGLIDEVICVDDCSVDQTAETIISMIDELPVRLVSMPRNGGKWKSIRVGMGYAKTDAVLLLDADNSVSICELERIGIANVRRYVAERVSLFGSRFMKGSKVDGKGLLRTIVSVGYRFFVRFAYNYASGKAYVDDMQCPMKLVYKSNIIEMLQVDRWAGDMELACCIQGEIRNVPVFFIHAKGGSVKISTVFEMFFETIRVARRFRKWKSEGLYN